MSIYFSRATIETADGILKISGTDTDIIIKAADILYIESFNKTIVIHTAETLYMIKAKISELYETLQQYGFVQIHKSYIVNLHHIKSMKNYIVTLYNGKQLHTSQRRWKHIKAIYNEKNTVCR